MNKTVPLCSNSAVQLRFLSPDDLEEVKNLCTEWFPIEYPDNWYRDVTSNEKFFSLAAIYDRKIIGLIIAEIKAHVNCKQEDHNILSPHFPIATQVAYILSLGVVQNYRRNGIASLLLENLISYLTAADESWCKAIYLHVLTSNSSAIRFYERRSFQMHSYLPYYYSIQGKHKDGYLYVLYLNGGHPPWTVLDYIKHGMGAIRLVRPCSITQRLCRGIVQVLGRIIPGMGRFLQLLTTTSS